jgi:DNA-binding beta-propeller fold protein YncE
VTLIGVIAVALAAVGVITIEAPAQSATSLVAVRTIGQPGHAEHYGWGQDTIPPGFAGAGNVLATDYWNFRVTELDPQGNFVRHVITNDGRHQAPYDVAVNPVNGDIAIGDVDGGRNVDIYSLDGRYLRSCGNGALWNYPSYLDYDAAGRLAVADSRGHKIVVLNPSTCQVTVRFGSQGRGDNQFQTPRGIDWAPDGTLWISDINNRRVVQWTVGAASASFRSKFAVAGGDNRGLLYNRDNNQIYVVNGSASTVDRYSTTGVKLGSFGGYGTGPGKFSGGGRGITRDGAGNIWVGDMPNFRTQSFTATGTYRTSYPDPASPPPLGGYAMPASVAVMSDGTVAGLDTFNWRVNIHNADGSPRSAFGSRQVFNYPRGMAAYRADNTLLIGNSDSVQVDKYSLSGTRLWSVGGIKSWAIAVDQVDGTVYAAQPFVNNVIPIRSNGTKLTAFGAGALSVPKGIAVDPVDRTIWVSNSGSGRIVHFSRTGQVLGSFSSGAGKAADLEVDQSTIYLADQGANVIRMYDKSGAPRGSFGGSGTQLGKFRGPMGMDLLGDRLFVIEMGGERIQELRIVRTG